MTRRMLRPEKASTEGVRQLREALLRVSSTALARQLACDPSTVRRIAREERTPGPELRVQLAVVLGTPVGAWEVAPARDAYTEEPEPTRKRR